MKKITAEIYLIVCALTETKDHINPFQVDHPSPHHQIFDIFMWLERVAWNEYTVDKFSYLKWLKIFINVEFKNEVIYMDPLFQKLSTVLNFKVLTSPVEHSMSGVQRRQCNIQGSGSSVQSPASKVQRPASRVQSPASRAQLSESNVQSPTSNSCVQSPGIPVCLFYLLLYAKF